MDLSNSRPIEEHRNAQQSHDRSHGGSKSVERAAHDATEAPTADGVLSSADVADGETPAATRDSQTRDYAGQMAESLQRIARAAGLPAHTTLDIQVDRESNQTRFLLLDRESGQLVRVVPDDEFAELLARAASQRVSGVAIDHLL